MQKTLNQYCYCYVNCVNHASIDLKGKKGELNGRAALSVDSFRKSFFSCKEICMQHCSCPINLTLSQYCHTLVQVEVEAEGLDPGLG